VVAFTWPEPRLTGNPTEYLVQANKFAWLNGDVSLASDENGVAVFENLEVVGSTSDNLYLFFTCDALATAFWGTTLTQAEYNFDLPKFQSPAFIKSFVKSLEIVT